jgi:hypothetical protein
MHVVSARPKSPARWAMLAYAIGALSAATTVGGFALQLVDGRTTGTSSVDWSGTVLWVTFAATGALIASRRPANPIGWFFLFSGAVAALSAISNEYLHRELVAHGSAFIAPATLRSYYEWAWVPVIVPVVAFVPMFFPNGHLLSARWRPMPIVAVVGTVTVIVAITLTPSDERNGPQLGGPNPYAIEASWVPPLQLLGFGLLLVAILFAVASLLVRMRRGTPTERQQVKTFFYATMIWPAALVASGLAGLIPSAAARPVPPLVLQLLAIFGVGAIPVAVAIAILRYRLYEIDVLIRRTLIYGMLSAVLVAAYAIGVGVIQFALSPVTSGNGLAVAISTLAVVALFQPVRRRIRSAVDRRFYRRTYDAARTLDSFAERLRDEIDLDALQAELVRAARDAVQPVHASLWLRVTHWTPPRSSP